MDRPDPRSRTQTPRSTLRPGKPDMPFTYVYILKDHTGRHRYVGETDDLNERLERHNRGEVPHTSRYLPWKIESAVAFDSKAKATAFERYLKSHAGREWAKRHL